MNLWILAAAAFLVCFLLGFWTLFGKAVKRLPLCLAPRMVARHRLKRFVLSGKKVRIVCFGNPEEGEDPGFHFALDARICGKLRLDVLVLKEIEPPSIAQRAAEFSGRTAEAYCYHEGRGLQLIGTLEQTPERPQFCLFVRRIKLSGRGKEIFIR